MNACVIDWGLAADWLSAIATIGGTFAAIFIFFQWKKQKASEVIANEAKEILADIYENLKLITNLTESFGSGKPENLQQHLTNYQIDKIYIDNKEILKRITLLSRLNKDDRLNEITKVYIESHTHLLNFYKKEGSDYLKIIEIHNKHVQSFKALNLYIIDIALYRNINT